LIDTSVLIDLYKAKKLEEYSGSAIEEAGSCSRLNLWTT